MSAMEIDPSTNFLDEHSHSHPDPHHQRRASSASHHRKISLQSPLDLSYLRSNLQLAARQRLDLHFPPSHSQSQSSLRRREEKEAPLVINLDGAGDTRSPEEAEAERGKEDRRDHREMEDDDPMRAHVAALVREFIAQTFSSASHSIEINGLDASSSSSSGPQASQPQQQQLQSLPLGGDALAAAEEERIEYEAYDARLTAKVAELYAETERLSAVVAGLRRRGPREGAERAAGEVMRALDGDSEEEKKLQEERREVEGGLRLDGFERAGGWEGQTDLEKMYERGLCELAVLAGAGHVSSSSEGTTTTRRSLTETVGRVQRAGVVAREFD